MHDKSDAESNIRKPIIVWGLETKRGFLRPVCFRYKWQAVFHKIKNGYREDKVRKGELRRA